jgi:hypothetical protein
MEEIQRREQQRGPTAARMRKNNSPAKRQEDDMAEAKRRERERGPVAASAMVKRSKENVRFGHADKPNPKVGDSDLVDSNKGRASAAITASRAKQEPRSDADLAEVKRRERDRGPATAAAMVQRRNVDSQKREADSSEANGRGRGHQAASSKTQLRSDDDLAEAKRRERKRGPATAAAMVKRSNVDNQIREADSSEANISERGQRAITSNAQRRNDDDLAEAKRRERERGPATAAAMVKRSNIDNQKKEDDSSEQGKQAFVYNSQRWSDDDLAEAKRRERERGPATAAAMVKRNSVDNQKKEDDLFEPNGRERGQQAVASSAQLRSDDDLAEAKRRERERGPAVAAARTNRALNNKRRSAAASAQDNDSSSNDSAYALAMVRTDSELEDAKLKAQISGPSIAAATSGEIHRGAYNIIGRELREKEEQNRECGPSISAPLASACSMSESPYHVDEEARGYDDFVEVQNEAPVAFPGAFAVQGVDVSEPSEGSNNDTIVSEFDDNAPMDMESGQFDNTNSPVEALEAEVYEEVVLDGAVVLPQDDDALDEKAVRRLRMIQFSVICFALGAIALIVTSVLTFSDYKETTPAVKGWIQVGPELYGPIDEPQTLLGFSVAMASNGTHIAAAAPGVDLGSSLNVGEIYIMEQKQALNGTEWSELGVLSGLGPSEDAKLSLAMSSNSSIVAVGHPLLQNGSKVQIYRELNGAWSLDAFPIGEDDDGGETWFGYDIDLSAEGNTLAIGAPIKNSAIGLQTGVVQVYRRNETTRLWKKLGDDLIGSAANGFFGWSVVLSKDGKRLAAGAPVINRTTGLVRVFEWDGAKWVQIGDDILGDKPLNRFGESVSLSADGKVLAVGAIGTAFDTGYVRVFRETNNRWIPDAETIQGDKEGEGFGTSLALSARGDVLVIGAPHHDRFGVGAGRLQVFQYNVKNNKWEQLGSDIGNMNALEMGTSVAISWDGKRVAGGAPMTVYDGSISRAGSVFVYDRDEKEQDKK